MVEISGFRIKDNFEDLKSQFKLDTGKDWNSATLMYISYVNMRVNDFDSQVNCKKLETYKLLTDTLISKIDDLCKEINKLKK